MKTPSRDGLLTQVTVEVAEDAAVGVFLITNVVVFDANLAPVLEHLVVHEMTSVEAAELFDDKSVSFVFIDAAHDYESVRADILAWLPKLKPGGWMAGDDFYWGGQGEMRPIFRAVSELLPDFAVRGGSWEWVKP